MTRGGWFVRWAALMIAGLLACGNPAPDGGDAGRATDAETSCEPPRKLCGGSCISPETDPLHCGQCGNECPAGAFCGGGACARTCSSGLMPCGSSCVDLSIDHDHCGGCDRRCTTDRECRGGSCECPDTYTECGGTCINSDTDVASCGFCGRLCGGDQICSAGSCVCAGGVREAACHDGTDNDCDHLVDCQDPDCVGSTRPCAGRCGPGAETCGADGRFGPCVGGNGSQEICGDGIDQDCDGRDARNPDVWEPNNSCGECALIEGTDPQVSLDARFDSVEDAEDCYRFQGDDGTGYPEHIVLMLERIPAGQDYDLYLYRNFEDCGARMPLQSSEAYGNVPEMIDWSERFATNDDSMYYIRVVRFSGHSCTDDYRLTVDGLR